MRAARRARATARPPIPPSASRTCRSPSPRGAPASPRRANSTALVIPTPTAQTWSSDGDGGSQQRRRSRTSAGKCEDARNRGSTSARSCRSTVASAARAALSARRARARKARLHRAAAPVHLRHVLRGRVAHRRHRCAARVLRVEHEQRELEAAVGHAEGTEEAQIFGQRQQLCQSEIAAIGQGLLGRGADDGG